jgi:hypothetical protein
MLIIIFAIDYAVIDTPLVIADTIFFAIAAATMPPLAEPRRYATFDTPFSPRSLIAAFRLPPLPLPPLFSPPLRYAAYQLLAIIIDTHALFRHMPLLLLSLSISPLFQMPLRCRFHMMLFSCAYADWLSPRHFSVFRFAAGHFDIFFAITTLRYARFSLLILDTD